MAASLPARGLGRTKEALQAPCSVGPQVFLNTSNDVLTNLWEVLFSNSTIQLLNIHFFSDILNYQNVPPSPGQGQIYCETNKF